MSDKIIVTIARQYGSGGHAVGELVANNFNMAYHDKSLIEKSAQKMGVSAEMLQSADEKATPSFLYSIATGNYDVYPLSINFAPYEMPINDKLFILQSEVIKAYAAEGSCVIIGRCSDYVLREEENVFRIFIYGDIEHRKERVQSRHPELKSSQIIDVINKTDKRRASYYNFYTGNKWGKYDNYDMAINSSTLGIDDTAELIAACAKKLMEE